MNEPRRSSRRDFLKGRAAADRLLDLTQGEASPSASPSGLSAAPAANFWMQLTRRAMACDFEIFFDSRRYPHGAAAALAAFDRIDELEDQLSVYRDHTELSRLNQTAHAHPVAVEPGLFGLLQQALAIGRASGGAFDITSGPLSKAWGFYRREGRVPTQEELADALARVGGDGVVLDPEQLTVHFLRAGTELNVNSIGKGYALDRAAEPLAEEVGDFLFHGGQSSVLARGGGAPNTDFWRIGLPHPLRPERRIAEFYLRNEALGTSGSGMQYFHHQGRRYGHLLDPRTGQPAEGVYSATVIAPTAAEADALATAFYVLGPAAALDYCAAHPGLAALLVCPAKRAGELAFHSHGLDESRFRLLPPAD